MTFRLRDVWARYPRAARPVFEKLDLDVGPGATALEGPNGCGKTTLLHLIGGLLGRRWWGGRADYAPAAGEAVPLAGLSGGAAAALRRRDFGYAPQAAHLLPHLTCLENVAAPLVIAGARPAEAAAQAREYLLAADPELAGRGADPAGELSPGLKKRASLHRAMVRGPRVLLADEPFAYLDPGSKGVVARLLAAWRDADRGRALVFVSHEPEQIARLADRVVALRPGAAS